MLPLDGLWLNASKPEPSLDNCMGNQTPNEWIINSHGLRSIFFTGEKNQNGEIKSKRLRAPDQATGQEYPALARRPIMPQMLL